MDKEENIKLITQAYNILKNENAFHKSTIYLQNASLKGVTEEEYQKLNYKFKAIRQDFTKILTIMNCIDNTYSAYKSDSYVNSYVSVVPNQATNELGCFIEYLFAKYRVIIEYVQQILEICIPYQFDEKQKASYNSLSKSHKKYKFLLNYISENSDNINPLLNMEWFQNIRIDRDFIIHDGATCLVYGDKENLMFNVMTTDAMDKEEIESDYFFSNQKGLIYYELFWGLQISKLIIYVETVFKFLISIADISNEQKDYLNFFNIYEKDGFIDSDGNELRNIRSVLVDMLERIIEV